MDTVPPGGEVLPYKGLMGTCGIFVLHRVSILSFLVLIRVSILSRAIIPIMALDFINFCLKQGIFSWTALNSLRVCSTN